MLKTLSIFFTVCIALTLGAYPTTYPFENEAYTPPSIPSSTPNWTLDPVTDTGGYVYFGPYTLSEFEGGILNDADFPYAPHMNGYCRYMLVVTYSAPPVLPLELWNCTAKEIVFTNSDFTGLVNTKKVCDPGSCCEMLIGEAKFGDDQADWHKWFDDRVAAAICGDADEITYCVMVGGHFQTNCFENYVTPVERRFVLNCPDLWALFYLTCPVYKQAYTVMNAAEPPLYLDGLSMEEQMYVDVVTQMQDRICHPYSYYYPTSAGTSSGTDAGGSSTVADKSDDSSAASSDTTDDSSAAGVLSVFGFFSLLCSL